MLAPVLTLLLLLAAPAGAQAPPPAVPADSLPADTAAAAGAANGVRTVEGRVVRPGAEAFEPVIGTWVTLHRVGQDRAGPLDSMRTTSDGAYRFSYRQTGAPDAIYFVSASYAGIAYFSSGLSQPQVSGPDAEIQVFDTTSSGIRLTVRGRHIILSASTGGTRRALIEVFEITNDSSRTLIGRSDKTPTFRVRIPQGAQDFKVAQGDVPADAVTFSEGEVLVQMPFAPGLKRLSFSYSVDADAFPLKVPVQFATGVLEVLAEDPQATVTAPRTSETAPASLDGRNFRRFLGNDVPAEGVLEITLPGSAQAQKTRIVLSLVAAIALAMLVSLARAFGRRTAPRTPGVASAVAADREAERLARQIADLDAKFERARDPDDAARAEYAQRRQSLKSALTEALISRDAAR
ncbi:MAG: hypothetical protein IT355_07190 [Gemmatimonadaceae bacterium]|nr:hypothetical protein [Gemmatimonadaceae bacterium]